MYFAIVLVPTNHGENSKDPAEGYSGGVASTMNLATGADCNGGGDGGYVEETGPCEVKLNKDLKFCNDALPLCKGDCDRNHPNSWWDRFWCKQACNSQHTNCLNNAYWAYETCTGN